MRARRRALTRRPWRPRVVGGWNLSSEETDVLGGANDEGSGTILGVAIIAATMLATGLVVTTFSVLALQQGVHNAADAAALAAADIASGAIGGFPCEAAEQAATLNGASVSLCGVDGLIAEISVERAVGPFMLRSRARAGPPDGDAD
ncbi:Rv3654c family TadE-like protein [Leifsonia sp. A12D58]|uniref:Rv3654c family TadE-like protein n=1 Tax=Leifsonia sp. A12D58 TaxID=3397674 RepID=UPI0039E1CA68